MFKAQRKLSKDQGAYHKLYSLKEQQKIQDPTGDVESGVMKSYLIKQLPTKKDYVTFIIFENCHHW